jgi:hypothetical protein
LTGAVRRRSAGGAAAVRGPWGAVCASRTPRQCGACARPAARAAVCDLSCQLQPARYRSRYERGESSNEYTKK